MTTTSIPTHQYRNNEPIAPVISWHTDAIQGSSDLLKSLLAYGIRHGGLPNMSVNDCLTTYRAHFPERDWGRRT